MKRYSLYILAIAACGFIFSACQTTTGNTGRMQMFPLMSSEADWIRNGEPIEFEGEKWYPADIVEVLLDSEVFLLGEHRGLQFFVEKADVRPYNGLYTKFDVNKFRLFEKKSDGK